MIYAYLNSINSTFQKVTVEQLDPCKMHYAILFSHDSCVLFASTNVGAFIVLHVLASSFLLYI